MKPCYCYIALCYCLFFSLLFLPPHAEAQYDTENGPAVDIDEDDLNTSGDIFTDYSEDIEASQVLEDERFYRYGRYYSFNISAGLTSFTGNRGIAYEDKHPSLGISLVYFMNFQMAFGLGAAYSKHYMMVNEPTKGFQLPGGAGLIEVNMFRSFFFYRYYLDTSDLGTAITYSNPYAIARAEFWNQTSKFIDQTAVPNESSGAIGAALGLGLEFPIKLRESYIGVELLYHMVNFRDAYTQLYRPVKEGQGGGYSDLTGNIISTFLSYVVSW
ncbi:MAG: hypothetical protein HQK50_16975 [Oligoflexia bacterium]|nr:hypothetical protein [Oligoflexia bacterium]